MVMHFIISREIVVPARARQELTSCKEFHADVWRSDFGLTLSYCLLLWRRIYWSRYEIGLPWYGSPAHHIILLTLVVSLVLNKAFVETLIFTLRKMKPSLGQNDVLGSG